MSDNKISEKKEKVRTILLFTTPKKDVLIHIICTQELTGGDFVGCGVFCGLRSWNIC